MAQRSRGAAVPRIDGPVLRGSRVTLRPMQPSDSAALERALRDPRVTRYLPARVRAETGAQFVARARKEQRQGRGFCFAIQLGRGPEAIGQIRFIDWSRRERTAEIGVWLRREFWGRGLGTEALRAICRFGFRSMRLERIGAQAVVENSPSDAMLRKVRFLREGRLRSRVQVGSRRADVWVYGILRSEFATARGALTGSDGSLIRARDRVSSVAGGTSRRASRARPPGSKTVRIVRLRRGHASRLAQIRGLLDATIDLGATRDYLGDPRNVFFLATQGANPVGFVRGTALAQLTSGRPQMFLYEVGVARAYRRTGVGAALVHRMLEYCRRNDFDELFVLTSPGNRAAVRLYRSTGAVTETEGDRLFVYRLKG